MSPAKKKTRFSKMAAEYLLIVMVLRSMGAAPTGSPPIVDPHEISSLHVSAHRLPRCTALIANFQTAPRYSAAVWKSAIVRCYGPCDHGNSSLTRSNERPMLPQVSQMYAATT